MRARILRAPVSAKIIITREVGRAGLKYAVTMKQSLKRGVLDMVKFVLKYFVQKELLNLKDSKLTQNFLWQ